MTPAFVLLLFIDRSLSSGDIAHHMILAPKNENARKIELIIKDPARGIRVGSLLDCFGIKCKSLILIEEPPCVLQGVALLQTICGVDFYVEFQLDLSRELVSTKAKWEEKAIRNATIREIIIEVVP